MCLRIAGRMQGNQAQALAASNGKFSQFIAMQVGKANEELVKCAQTR